jgi:hypothetical protein
MTSENQADTGFGVVDAARGPSPDSGSEAAQERPAPRPAATRAPGAQPAAAGRRPDRRLDLDWEREPTHGIDPEDSRGGRADNLARLLDDVPPHHVDH